MTTCHGCARVAIVRFRVVPYGATRTRWDTTPRDVNACVLHIQAAKAIGTVLSATPLSDEITVRTVQP